MTRASQPALPPTPPVQAPAEANLATNPRRSTMSPTTPPRPGCVSRRVHLTVCLLAVFLLPALATSERRPRWASRPAVRRLVPRRREATRARTPVHAFLLVALEAKGLTFSPDADRVTLLRRAYLDLWR